MDINRIDLNLLKIFDSVYRLRNLAAVAREVHLSQPAVSHALARLRASLDDPLFTRTPHGLEPTARCERLAVPIHSALDTIRDSLIDSADFKPEDCTREFRLLLSDVGEMLLVPSLMNHLRTVAPRVKLAIVQAPRAHYDRIVRDREVDIAVGHLNMARQSFREQPLFRDHGVVIRRKIPDQTRGEMTMKMFAEASHVVISPPDDPVEEMFAERNINRHVALRMPNYFALPDVIESSDLIVTVPSRIARFFQRHSKLEISELPFPSPLFDVRMFWHTRHDSDPAHAWLRDMFLFLFNDERV
ncbi:LysR family transcriptional regulator [Pseudomonas aeruginosa]|jgi:DNA-binding transcriptional LysR family regulator|nr:LysR family transcriptional regulator [Pseudomonas aeruginosa]MCS9139115.1 LysR family transcriptional regulator [Pseudomonas aeruginosa]MCS9211904.1 LysR family transcriptional regulator [Pseudomonas aeruginosa]